MPDRETVLLVVVCVGQRCAGLLRLSAADGHGDLRSAVRERPDALLLHTACQGECHRGGIASVGWAWSAAGKLTWGAPPLVIGMLEADDRAAALAAWVRASAPDLAPRELIRDAV